MPVAKINILKGHDKAALQKIIAQTTDAMANILNAPKARLMIWIEEIDPELWGFSGNPAALIKNIEERKKHEIPFVQMTLMEGRPIEQFHAMISEISQIVSQNLEIDKAQVRVHIALAQPDCWGIGGIPASISRAKELEARKLQAQERQNA